MAETDCGEIGLAEKCTVSAREAKVAVLIRKTYVPVFFEDMRKDGGTYFVTATFSIALIISSVNSTYGSEKPLNVFWTGLDNCVDDTLPKRI